ncbi:hypothetical protein GCM10023196_037350 [Actinoallomurus vinaceus]|uniref:SWIM-type domain-containing protein n=1 Tax=Actinoallomurus vinaceus TaxID=1080074 RepID=A0ABP8UAY4_9ACTN
MDTATRCRKCGRPLRNAKSIARGYGPTCKARIVAAAKTTDLSDYTPAQIDRAIEVIEMDAAIPTGRPNVLRIVSGDGSTSYLTTDQACNCPAGLRQRRCYHRATATILNAARADRAA